VQERNQRRKRFFQKIEEELDRAYKKHPGKSWSRHEFHSIVLEEFEEMWDDIKTDKPLDVLLKEIVQVAAMCFRYAETGEMGKVIDKPALP